MGEGSDSTAHARKERENVWIANAKARGGGCRIEGNSMGSTNIAVHRVTVDKRQGWYASVGGSVRGGRSLLRGSTAAGHSRTGEADNRSGEGEGGDAGGDE